MKKLKLDIEALSVTAFETARVPEAAPKAAAMTDGSTYCNSCVIMGCHWTD